MADLKALKTVYITPPSILDPTRRYGGGRIDLDPATLPSNPTRADHFCIEKPVAPNKLSDYGMVHFDGLRHPWHDHGLTFVNPPYSGRVMKDWVGKLHHEVALGATVIALLPCGARYSTRYWQDHAFNSGLDAICFPRGRVKFRRPDGTPTTGSNPYDSQIMAFNVDTDRFIELFSHLGKTLRVEVF